MELRRHTWVNWFVTPICLVDVPSALLGPIVCWYRPWNCQPSAAGLSRSRDSPSGTACRTTWYLPRLCQPSISVLKHFCSSPRSSILSLISGIIMIIPHLQWILEWFYYLDHSKNTRLIDWNNKNWGEVAYCLSNRVSHLCIRGCRELHIAQSFQDWRFSTPQNVVAKTPDSDACLPNKRAHKHR